MYALILYNLCCTPVYIWPYSVQSKSTISSPPKMKSIVRNWHPLSVYSTSFTFLFNCLYLYTNELFTREIKKYRFHISLENNQHRKQRIRNTCLHMICLRWARNDGNVTVPQSYTNPLCYGKKDLGLNSLVFICPTTWHHIIWPRHHCKC